MRNKIGLVILIVLLQGCFSDTPCNQVLKKYVSLRDSGRENNYLLNWLTQYVSANSHCVDSIVLRADLFNSIDSINLAKKDYKQVITLDSGNVYSLYQLGLLYQTSDQNDSAIWCFTQAISRKTYNGAVITYKKNPGITDKYSKYDIPYEELLFCRGISFYTLRELKNAESDFNICLESGYALKDIYLYLGGIFYESGNKVKACDFFNKAVSLKNINAESYLKKFCN